MAFLPQLPNLDEIRLVDTQLTDEHLLDVVKCRGVTRLTLSYNQITDAGVTHLAGGELAGLYYLDLDDNPIEGRTLGALQKLTNLHELHLSDTKVNNETVGRAAAYSGARNIVALPYSDHRCRIRWHRQVAICPRPKPQQQQHRRRQLNCVSEDAEPRLLDALRHQNIRTEGGQ
jgi:hypothetical protein